MSTSMKNIAQMLDDEITTSENFSKQNFGLKYGDDFRELFLELTENESTAMNMMIAVMVAQYEVREMSEFISKFAIGERNFALILKGIRKCPEVVEGYIAHFYWGMQIGRKLAQQEAAALRSMEDKS